MQEGFCSAFFIEDNHNLIYSRRDDFAVHRVVKPGVFPPAAAEPPAVELYGKILDIDNSFPSDAECNGRNHGWGSLPTKIVPNRESEV